MLPADCCLEAKLSVFPQVRGAVELFLEIVCFKVPV